MPVNDGDLRHEVATNRNRDAVGNYLFLYGYPVEISNFSEIQQYQFPPVHLRSAAETLYMTVWVS